MEENPENNGNRPINPQPVTIRSTEDMMEAYLKVYNNEVDINDKDIEFYKEIERAINGENIGTNARIKDEISPAADDIGVNKSYVKEEKGKQCGTCNITVENEKELKIHEKFIHGPIPNRDKSSRNKDVKENKNERVSATLNDEIDERVSPVTKSDLEKHINEISKKINIPLEMQVFL